jgi:hypothetical protein
MRRVVCHPGTVSRPRARRFAPTPTQQRSEPHRGHGHGAVAPAPPHDSAQRARAPVPAPWPHPCGTKPPRGERSTSPSGLDDPPAPRARAPRAARPAAAAVRGRRTRDRVGGRPNRCARRPRVRPPARTLRATAHTSRGGAEHLALFSHGGLWPWPIASSPHGMIAWVSRARGPRGRTAPRRRRRPVRPPHLFSIASARYQQ